jgi:hypothetical protein
MNLQQWLLAISVLKKQIEEVQESKLEHTQKQQKTIHGVEIFPSYVCCS